MKKAIVTGANGFVGGATLRELLHHGYEVWAVGHQDHFSNVPEDPNVHKVSCDLEETKTLPEKIPTDRQLCRSVKCNIHILIKCQRFQVFELPQSLLDFDIDL